MDLFWQINWEEMLSALIGTTFLILLPVSIVVVSSMVMFPLIDVAFKAKPAPKDTRERRTIDNRQSMMPYSIIQPTGMRGEVTELDLMRAERDDKAFADNWRDAEIKKLRADFVEPWHDSLTAHHAQLSGPPWLALRHAKFLRPDAAPHSQLMSYPTAQERAALDPLVGMAHIARSPVPTGSEGAPPGPVTAPPTPLSDQLQPYSGVNTVARKTSKKSAKVAKKAATKRVAAKATKPREMPPKSRSRKVAKPLLAGGNPQIAKADGDAPVQAYIAAMPGWKRDVERRLDALRFSSLVPRL
jgi:hypothetical protein